MVSARAPFSNPGCTGRNCGMRLPDRSMQKPLFLPLCDGNMLPSLLSKAARSLHRSNDLPTGSVPLHADRTPAGWPGDVAPKTRRRQYFRTFKTVSYRISSERGDSRIRPGVRPGDPGTRRLIPCFSAFLPGGIAACASRQATQCTIRSVHKRSVLRVSGHINFENYGNPCVLIDAAREFICESF